MAKRRGGPYYSERKAMARMGRLRAAIHRFLRTVYWAIPEAVLFDRDSHVRPTGHPILFVWRQYRRTWPR